MIRHKLLSVLLLLALLFASTISVMADTPVLPSDVEAFNAAGPPPDELYLGMPPEQRDLALKKEVVSASCTEPSDSVELMCHTAQTDAADSEETRVRSTVDTYFSLKYESRVQGRALDLGIVVDRSELTGKTLYDYEMGRLQYSLMCWQETNTIIVAFNYHPVYDTIEIIGDMAVVYMHPWVDLYHADSPDRAEEYGGELHILKLVSRPTGWQVVADAYYDEMKVLFPIGTDFVALQVSFAQRMAETRRRWAELEQQYGPRQAVIGGVVTPLVTETYDRGKASWYGKAYTNNDGSNSTTNYNSLFVNYAGSWADCQNFVSQCIWYGFGGVNSAASIQAHFLPMCDNQYGTTNWYADYYSSLRTWDNVSSFYNMIKANYDNNRPGVQGYQGSLSLTWAGDYVVQGDWAHAMIVVGITDYDGDGQTDYNEIYISGHTSNRLNVRLSDLVPDPGQIRYIYVIRFRIP